MIGTSSYKNWNLDKYRTFSISFDCGRDALYNGKSFSKLFPKLSFWRIWRSNIGIISEEENNRYYVEQYYNQVLLKLDLEDIYRVLDYSILLCYEDNTQFCHRHIVAEWFELLLGVKVSEKKAQDYTVEEVDRPGYIRTYLEDAMRKNRNMRRFHSLRALYLFEKGEELGQKVDRLEKMDGKRHDEIRKLDYFLRWDADEVEYEYNKSYLVRVKK